MANWVYILYSPKLDKYYIGETEDFQLRLSQYNTGFFKAVYTSQTNDWSEFLLIECSDRNIARKLEAFITLGRYFITSAQL